MAEFKDEIVAGGDPAALLNRLCDLVQRPRLGLRITASAEVANVRDITIQVINRLNANRKGRHLIEFWMSTSPGGAVSSSQTVGSLSVGVVLNTVQADKHYQLVTSENGTIVVPITSGSTGTLYVNAVILGNVVSVPFAWA